jgi:hypothetical protein
MPGMPEMKRFTVVTGHYGCGKTNLSINLALDQTERFSEVTLVDLDVVNPYFRSSDYAAQLSARGVRVISPTFAGTTLDVPALPASISSALESEGAVILDVGGDDAGATALGVFSRTIEAIDYGMLYVVNRYRNLTSSPGEAAEILAEIEAASHLKATGVVNNSHLKQETTPATILDSVGFARETAALLGLPLVCTTVPRWLADAFPSTPGVPGYLENAYSVEVCVRAPWEERVGIDEEVG